MVSAAISEAVLLAAVEEAFVKIAEIEAEISSAITETGEMIVDLKTSVTTGAETETGAIASGMFEKEIGKGIEIERGTGIEKGTGRGIEIEKEIETDSEPEDHLHHREVVLHLTAAGIFLLETPRPVNRPVGDRGMDHFQLRHQPQQHLRDLRMEAIRGVEAHQFVAAAEDITMNIPDHRLAAALQILSGTVGLNLRRPPLRRFLHSGRLLLHFPRQPLILHPLLRRLLPLKLLRLNRHLPQHQVLLRAIRYLV